MLCILFEKRWNRKINHQQLLASFEFFFWLITLAPFLSRSFCTQCLQRCKTLKINSKDEWIFQNRLWDKLNRNCHDFAFIFGSPWEEDESDYSILTSTIFYVELFRFFFIFSRLKSCLIDTNLFLKSFNIFFALSNLIFFSRDKTTDIV